MSITRTGKQDDQIWFLIWIGPLKSPCIWAWDTWRWQLMRPHDDSEWLTARLFCLEPMKQRRCSLIRSLDAECILGITCSELNCLTWWWAEVSCFSADEEDECLRFDKLTHWVQRMSLRCLSVTHTSLSDLKRRSMSLEDDPSCVEGEDRAGWAWAWLLASLDDSFINFHWTWILKLPWIDLHVDDCEWLIHVDLRDWLLELPIWVEQQTLHMRVSWSDDIQNRSVSLTWVFLMMSTMVSHMNHVDTDTLSW